MLGNNYEVDIASDFQTFEFISVGTKGNITKVVRYTEIDIKGVFSLGFGDKNLETGHISDLIISNNGDSQKVLSTVAATLKVFMNNYPEAIVIATGSTEARTRLYQMGIAKSFETIQRDYIVLGLKEKDWEPFKKNVTYEAFLVKKNNIYED